MRVAVLLSVCMKRIALIILFAFTCLFVFAQSAEQHKEKKLKPAEQQTQLAAEDLSGIFTFIDNSDVFGFIGENYQRLRIKFISVSKTAPDDYLVHGKTMFDGSINEFKGDLMITGISKITNVPKGIADVYKTKGIKGQFILTGTYTLAENKEQLHTGTYKGTFKSNYYIDSVGHPHYDDIDSVSDGFTNNLFTGTWTSYENNTIKKCNWGDYRIPDSGDLDTGTADFIPNDKYVKFGWQLLRDETKLNPADKDPQVGEKSHWWQ